MGRCYGFSFEDFAGDVEHEFFGFGVFEVVPFVVFDGVCDAD